MSADQTQEERDAYIAGLETELAGMKQRGDVRAAEVEAELARVGVTGRTGKKATRLKGEGREA